MLYVYVFYDALFATLINKLCNMSDFFFLPSPAGEGLGVRLFLVIGAFPYTFSIPK